MRAAVIGIGNDHRGDDAVGLAVVRALKAHGDIDAAFIEHDGEVADLVERLGAAERVVLVDATLSDGEPGAIRRFDVAETRLPAAAFAGSTHILGLAEGVELARALRQLPPVCIVYAVEAAQFETGTAISSAVAAAIDPVARMIRDDLAALMMADGGTDA